MQEPLTLYKLIVLYMLDRVNFPLTKAQVADFITGKEYTHFLTLQQAISEMVTAGFIREESTHNRTLYHLTEEGSETIQFFKSNISPAIRKDVDTFMAEKAYELKNEVSVKADYYPNSANEYSVRCQIFESGSTLLDLTVSVPTEEEAISVTNNWGKRNQEIYAQIMAKLL